MFGDMDEEIRLRAMDSLHSNGRHNGKNIIRAGHTVTDYSVKSRENTPIDYLTINFSLFSFW